ncbi:Protein phosphatase PP2A regulatory subunit A [Entamoeba marina]
MQDITLFSFLEGLRNEDIEMRLEALTCIPMLIPELDIDMLKDVLSNLERSLFEEEELDMFASDQLSLFPQVLGEKNVSLLYPLFRLLLSPPEQTIRDKAFACFSEVITLFPEVDHLQFIEDLIPTSVYARISAAKILPLLPSNERIVQLFEVLSNDQCPVVRKCCAANISKLANISPAIIEQLSNDKIDSVPIYLDKFAHDPCWHVRYVCASIIGKCCDALPVDVLSKDIQQITLSLLTDEEDQVRAIAAKHIADITKKIPPESIISCILPVAHKLSTDKNVFVRSCLSSSITQLAPQLGKANCQEYLFSIIETCLQDENTEVQLKIITTLDCLNHVMVLSQLSQKVLATVMKLVNDSSWRCRLQTIELIPELIQQLTDCNFELVKVCVSVLTDKVYAIRVKAIENIKKLIVACGVDWVKSRILPSVISLANSSLYLHRIICMNCISQIIPSLSGETITTIIIPITLKLLSDKVPNVRFNAINTFNVIIPIVSVNVIQTRIKPALVSLKSDSDADVLSELSKTLDLVNQFLC